MQVFQFKVSIDTRNFSCVTNIKAELRMNLRKWTFYINFINYISCMHFQSQLIEAAQ